MLKIDAHLHVDLAGMNPDQVIDYMDDHGVERCWLLSWEELSPPIPDMYTPLPAAKVFELYEQHPDRILPFAAPDPLTKDLDKVFEDYIQHGLKGCGELKVTRQWEDESIGNYLDIVSQHKLPLLFHMEAPRMHYVAEDADPFERGMEKLMNGAFNGVVKHHLLRFAEKTNILKNHMENHLEFFPGYLHDFSGLEKRLQEFPEVDFIGHGPHFWNNIAENPSEQLFHDTGKIDRFGIIDDLLSVYDNLHCDISGKSGYNALIRDQEKARLFMEKHHEKILYGTDNTGYNYEEMILSLGLPEDKLKDIFCRNAEALTS